MYSRKLPFVLFSYEAHFVIWCEACLVTWDKTGYEEDNGNTSWDQMASGSFPP